MYDLLFDVITVAWWRSRINWWRDLIRDIRGVKRQSDFRLRVLAGAEAQRIEQEQRHTSG